MNNTFYKALAGVPAAVILITAILLSGAARAAAFEAPDGGAPAAGANPTLKKYEPPPGVPAAPARQDAPAPGSSRAVTDWDASEEREPGHNDAVPARTIEEDTGRDKAAQAMPETAKAPAPAAPQAQAAAVPGAKTLAPGVPPPEDPVRIQAAKNFTEGYRRYKEKDIDGAITYFKLSLAGNPDNYMAYFHLANIFLEKKMYTEAEEMVTAASRLRIKDQTAETLAKEGAPLISDAEIMKFRGLAQRNFRDADKLLADGKLEEAVKLLESALALEPSNAKFLVRLGEVYYDLGLARKARGYFEKALLLDPDNRRANQKLARICEDSGDEESAKKHYDALYRQSGDRYYLTKMESCAKALKKEDTHSKFVVLKRRGNSVFGDAGYSNGLRMGDQLKQKFNVYRPYASGEIRDPRTTRVLGFEKPVLVGELLVTRIEEDHFEGMVVSERNGGIRVGDEIRAIE